LRSEAINVALLDPYWKGRLAIDANPATWLAVMIMAYGKDKAVDLVKGLVRNEIKVIRGRTLQAQLMAAGAWRSRERVALRLPGR